MSTISRAKNSVRLRRTARGWSQQQLADRAGLSRAGVSAIEAGGLAPSVDTALALSGSLGCTVEELFQPKSTSGSAISWAFAPPNPESRVWYARVGDETLAYPVEDDCPQLDWHDSVFRGGDFSRAESDVANRTLVVACCDPAAGLLAAEFARQFQFRMIVLRRSSRHALDLLATGKVHAAGLHLSRAGRQSENIRAARSRLGEPFVMVRAARWEEGLAMHPRLAKATVQSIQRSKPRWVGREDGSGARQCQDEVLQGRPAPRRVAFDHRSVVAAVRCGWADIGPCVRLTSEEAGLRFLTVQSKDYDLCFSAAMRDEPRLVALVATLRSRAYRSRISELPGYSTQHTGELLQ